MKTTSLLAISVLAACGGTQKRAPESAPQLTETKPAEPERAATPAEEPLPVVILDGTMRPGTRLAATLDEAVGPQFSSEGQRITASVLPAQTSDGRNVFPAGTKIVLRVVRIQAAMTGTLGYVSLMPRAIEFQGASFPVDGRIVGVELAQKASGRPVSSSTADVPGTIIEPGQLTPADRDRDILGKTAAISVGSGPPDHQLAKGSGLRIELRGPVPMALWEGKGGETLDLGWIREMVALVDTNDGSELAGKRIELTGVPVESVIGDVVFWVGPRKNQRVLVVMDQFLDNPEVKTVVRAGQTVDVVGVVEIMPPRSVAPLLWSMVTDKEAATFTPHPIYVYATKVQVTKAKPKSAKAGK